MSLNRIGILHIFDIDGTLCLDGWRLLPEHVLIINRLKSKGDEVWIASARHVFSVRDALLQDESLISVRMATQNGTQVYENGELRNAVYLKSEEKESLIVELQDNKQKISLLDFWFEWILYTYSLEDWEENFEKRYRKRLDWHSILTLLKEGGISMVHIVDEAGEREILPDTSNKSQILNVLPDHVRDVRLYGNGSNDLGLFQWEKEGIVTTRHGVWQHPKISELSERQFRDYSDLFEYLKET